MERKHRSLHKQISYNHTHTHTHTHTYNNSNNNSNNNNVIHKLKGYTYTYLK
jgi:hypothetical protein